MTDIPSDSPVSYCTPRQVRGALFPGGDADVGSASELDDADVQDAINDAQNEIDARLAGLYGTVVPFDPVPPIIATIARDKAAYLATLLHRQGSDVSPTDPVQLRYNRAEALLQGVQNGQIDLGLRDSTTGQPQEMEMPDMVVNPDNNADVFTWADVGMGVGADGAVRPLAWPQTFGPNGGPYP